ncbi:MAG: PilN domain-containing protein [Thermodesulfovibrionales bacterium]|jgi:type IV pilus assembly protein PilN
MIRVNLLEEKRGKKGKRPLSLLTLVTGLGIVTILLMAAISFYLRSQVAEMKKTSEANKVLLADLAKKAEAVKAYEKLNKEITQRSKIIESLRRNQAVPVRLLDIVGTRLPAGVWVSGFVFRDNGVALEGFAFTNNDIVSYVDNLKATPDLTEVYLEESRQADVGGVLIYKYRLNFKIKA